ncbi:hypothetical protein LGM21_07155 [Klebsiella quasipneumoniae subsp. quasipneumoniae]|uniref:hypothetical protein n=1 Tax=Klebsiella quasipneumoniae TaxID=1463165 RepID=UPI000432EB4E|nr:hypothetical protein [Klebsiella quasipneumoniae]UDC67295.1 hypothetical protein LGM21_07155 [Klebsiella quasipneumoniae subsp. quasipneumoniae]CDN01414.1 conserved hypothetical protein [Klebsiella quasipneumoniae subsp. quasipneumoniae]VGP67446.1 hypothetical protein SB00059_05166 [Klebsiella quasipneumoniae subsp. quasipneumoniae]
MTITLQTVNELIASLESAGELSIREQKFLKLAKAFKQLAAENVAMKAEWVRIFNIGYLHGHESTVEGYYVDIHQDDITTYHEDIVAEISEEQTPATDRIVAGFKADGVAEREKTITFTAAKKRTQDGVALIAIGKPYKIHNDDVIGEFFIGERGRYGVITMDRLDYFTTSDEYAWEFSLREGAK